MDPMTQLWTRDYVIFFPCRLFYSEPVKPIRSKESRLIIP